MATSPLLSSLTSTLSNMFEKPTKGGRGTILPIRSKDGRGAPSFAVSFSLGASRYVHEKSLAEGDIPLLQGAFLLGVPIGPLAQVGIQDPLAHPQVLRGDFQQLIIIDELQALLQAHGMHGH